MTDTQTAPDVRAARERILLVDDEPHIRGILSRWLSDAGYECAQAPTAEEAWDTLQNGDFHLLVSDVVMPDMSGMELLSKVRQARPDVAVLMVTAVDDRETTTRALRLGAYGYIIKPFDEDEVLININNALERRRLVLASEAYEQRLEETVRTQTAEIRESREEIALRLIAAQEYRHDETGAHVRRIGLYAEALARALNRSEETAEMLRQAAPMHDVGKIGIPDAILLKPGDLSADEWEVMKTHAEIGGRILEGTHIPMLQAAAQIAVAHHEKWDGSGYPKGLAGDDIPETARIVAAADVYDALVSSRVYRPALPEEEALDIMAKGRNRHFDPEILDCFMSILPEIRRIRQETRDRAGELGDKLAAVSALLKGVAQ